MTVDSTIFKAYDIRGVYPTQVNEEVAFALGRAYAVWLKKQSKKEHLQVVVGQDMRVSSPALAERLMAGLMDQGVEVIAVGLISTPTFYFAVSYPHYDGGIMISASHNPAEYNGFKIVRESAKPVSGTSGLQDLRVLIEKDNFKPAPQPGKKIHHENMVHEEAKVQLGGSDVVTIKPFSIVADTANGMGAQYLDELFTYLPCKLHKMNWQFDGTFPGHDPDPLKEDNLKYLQTEVLAQKADLGIATDGDGDRIFFVDNEGQTVPPAVLRGILAKVFLAEQPGATIGYDIRPGKITEDMILEYGGKPMLTRVGHSLIKEQMLQENSYFSGESSGHLFLNKDYGCFEMPMIMIIKFLQELSASGQTLADYVRPLKKYFPSGEINSTVSDVPAVLARLKETYHDGQQSELDGLSVEYPDWWFNVRASNTEPLIRLNLEARSKEVMEQKRDEVLEVLNPKL